MPMVADFRISVEDAKEGIRIVKESNKAEEFTHKKFEDTTPKRVAFFEQFKDLGEK